MTQFRKRVVVRYGVDTSADPGKPRLGARQLARRAVSTQVAEMAVDLFSDRGYAQTTVDDICQVAGISRTTFFRYFQSKEDVLLRDYLYLDHSLLAALLARPENETPWQAIRRALDPLIEQYTADSTRTLRSAKLFLSTPSLVTFHREKLARWGQVLVPELARRIRADPSDATDPRPAALISAAFACLDVALIAWATADGATPIARILDQAMSAIN
jgi:AcrR family transcriptional regulator